jgi:error-prone DNA polymerase
MSLPPRYVELHAHSAYSFLDGASAPEELAQAAAELGHEALALTDHDGVWGAMEFAQACRSFGVRPIVGSEVTITTPAAASPRLRCRRVRARAWRQVGNAPTGTSSLAPTGCTPARSRHSI